MLFYLYYYYTKEITVYATLEKDSITYGFFVTSQETKGFEYDGYKYKWQIFWSFPLLIIKVIASTKLALD